MTTENQVGVITTLGYFLCLECSEKADKWDSQ